MRVWARNKRGQMIHVFKAQSGQIYYDDLGRELIVKKRKYNRFFCLKANNQQISLAESEEHKLGKKILQKLFNNRLLEEYRINSKQRADLLLLPNLVIEIQCSLLMAKKLYLRHEDYKLAGYRDVWILGSKYNKLQLQLPFCYYRRTRGFYYYSFSEKSQILKCCYNLTNYAQTKQETTIRVVNDLFKIKKKKVKIEYNLNEQYRKSVKFLFADSRKEWQLKNIWYEQRLNLQDYLIYLAIPVDVPTLTKSDEYLLKSYFIWQLLGKHIVIKYNHPFVFIEKTLYLKLFKQSYLRNLKLICPDLQITSNLSILKQNKIYLEF